MPIPLKNTAEKEAKAKLAAKEAAIDKMHLNTAKQNSAFMRALIDADTSKPAYFGKFLEALREMSTLSETSPESNLGFRWIKDAKQNILTKLNDESDLTFEKVKEIIRRLLSEADKPDDETIQQLLIAFDSEAGHEPSTIITSLVDIILTMKGEYEASKLVSDIQTTTNLASSLQLMQHAQALAAKCEALEGSQQASTSEHPCSGSLDPTEVETWGRAHTLCSSSTPTPTTRSC